MDYDKFLWLLEELKIQYIPQPQYNRKESKRARRIRLACEEGLALKKAKMQAYQQKLTEEKLRFMEFKEKEMADIERQLKELGIPEMKSLDKTIKDLGMGHLLPEPQSSKSRRQLLLEKKFREKMIGEAAEETGWMLHESANCVSGVWPE